MAIDIHILGTRANVPISSRRHARHSGVIVEGEILLDAGERSYLRLRPRWTLITHFHPDHAFFVREPPAEKPEVLAPESDERCRATVVKPARPFRLGTWTITAIPLIHSRSVKAVAYRLDGAGKSILFTGDVLEIERRYHSLLRNLDLVITEGSFIRRGGLVRMDRQTGHRSGHAGLPDLIALFASFTRSIVVVHLGSWFYRDPRRAHEAVRALGRRHGVEARIAWDGMHVLV